MAKGAKTGGRELGTPNKLTKELRNSLKDIVYSEIEKIQNNFDKLDAKDRIELLIKILPFVLPKIEKVNYRINEPIDFED